VSRSGSTVTKSAAIFVRPQFLENGRNIEQRRRTKVRTMGIAEKNQIGASGKIGIRHHAAILPDHRKRTADWRRSEIRAAWHDGINQAGKAGEANREAKDYIKKLAGSLLSGSFRRPMLHAWKLLKKHGHRQCRNVKDNRSPRRFPKV
jgi:hypothetical protein